MRRITSLLAVLLVAATTLAGCSGERNPTTDRATTDRATTAVQPKRISLSLLVFNVENGGTRATDAVIKAVDADVVGVLESYNRLPEIAKAAGYPYYDVGLQILSKYPILEPSGADGLYSYIEVRPGQVVALVNTHLDYVHDGPYRLEHGVSVADVLDTERQVRLPTIETLLPSARALLGRGWPVLLTGDFNEPSHLDWTTRTAGQHGGVGPVAWPVSEAVVAAGFRDAFRVAHPDPVSVPGNTWGGVAGSHGSPRRIDFAYVGGPVAVSSSQVVGERGGVGVDRGFSPWTSDHRAVLSRLVLRPAVMPTTVALSARLVTRGDDVRVTYRAPAGSGPVRVSLRGPGRFDVRRSDRRGIVSVPTAPLPPGTYRVELVDARHRVLATNELTVRARHPRVRLSTDAATYAVGQPVTVRWQAGPANRWDWIGVFRAGADDTEHDPYLVWGYTGGHDAGALPPTTAGALTLGPDHQGAPWPLPPGDYVAHYLLTDQTHSAAAIRFTVR